MSETIAQPKTVVLNVNDTEAMRSAITLILQRADFEVLEAATGEEALSLIESREPHVVVLDVCLPDGNGFEICRRVRKNPYRSTMRILHTSAMYVSLEDKIESLESGADGFLEQPFELDELVSCVRSLLDSGQVAKALASETVGVPPRTDHVLQALDEIADGVFCLDPSWRFTFVNAMGELVLGHTRDELLGKVIWGVLPALDGSELGAGYRRAMTERVPVTVDGLRPAFDARLQARALPTSQGLLVFLVDVSSARNARGRHGTDVSRVSQLADTLRGA